MRDELGGDPVVVATGGLAPVITPHMTCAVKNEPWLTLIGLRLVFDRNAASLD